MRRHRQRQRHQTRRRFVPVLMGDQQAVTPGGRPPGNLLIWENEATGVIEWLTWEDERTGTTEHVTWETE